MTYHCCSKSEMATLARETKFIFLFSSCMCPHCKKVTAHGAAENSGSFSLFPFLFFKQKEYVIGCTKCFSIRPINKSDLNDYIIASSKYKALLENKISNKQFEEELEKLHLNVYRGIQEEGDGMWICPKCKEENPHEFELCFNCGTETNQTPTQHSTHNQLPHIGGGHPWEQ